MSATKDIAARPPVALTISGSDPSGGAGLQADLKVFAAHGVYGMAAVSLITVQNTRGVRAVEGLDADLVVGQAAACAEDIPPSAMKTGSLGFAPVVRAVAQWYGQLAGPPILIVDPVLVSKHGDPLGDALTVAAFARHLVPHAGLLTPNLFEAAALLGETRAPDVSPAGRRQLAQGLLELGARAVLLKDGSGSGTTVQDLLVVRGAAPCPFERPRIRTRSTHGSGCALSAAITARLARGEPLEKAVAAALGWIHRAIAAAPALGGGRGPLALGLDPGAGD